MTGMARVYQCGNWDDAVLILIRDLVVRYVEQWGRPPTVAQMKQALQAIRQDLNEHTDSA